MKEVSSDFRNCIGDYSNLKLNSQNLKEDTELAPLRNSAKKVALLSRFENYFEKSSVQLIIKQKDFQMDFRGRSSSFNGYRSLPQVTCMSTDDNRERKSKSLFHEFNKALNSKYEAGTNISNICNILDNLECFKNLPSNPLIQLKSNSTQEIKNDTNALLSNSNELLSEQSNLVIGLPTQQNFLMIKLLNESITEGTAENSLKLELLSFIKQFPELLIANKDRTLDFLRINFEHFFSSNDIATALIKMSTYQLSTSNLISLIQNIDFVSASMKPNYSNLIEYLRCICSSNMDITKIVLSKFDNPKIWKEAILNKYGKNIVEFFINEILEGFPVIRRRLYELIECLIIEFSRRNYATFVVQTYLSKERSRSALKTIGENIMNITSCRNGVFVVISATKSYAGEDLQYLLSRIVEFSEILSKNSFSSTLIEYVFINHKCAVNSFVRLKSHHFLGNL